MSDVQQSSLPHAFQSRFSTLVILLIVFFSGFIFYHFLYGKEENIVFPISLRRADVSTDVNGHMGEDIIAKFLAKRVRVLCMVMTLPANHAKKAVAVRDTWASRCNAHIFLSSVVNETLPSIAAVVNESREALWDKAKFAIHYAVKNYATDYDFFLKADDDTFVIVENLRKLLMDHSPEDPFIMGRRFRPFVKQGYLSGGGGYVMSRAALLNIHMGLLKEKECAGNESGGAEDVRIGKCAEVVGVRLIDSLDPVGLERFHPFGPSYMMDKAALNSLSWFQQYNYHKISTGFNCCSDYTVSFHYVKPEDMYVYHYFLYHLHPYGIHRDYQELLSFLSNKTNAV
ncbi:hypothetical protein EG68_09871 [Paragonimus skrjabini miyazakii]|uniref:N-acetylgalactosaminide beta-1,3-galactosyltransferase n=1 Tax=Paragonimus skrjabini miyazakii TaxID=59628 RepID=A0A8S9YF07_9TREM|nr:hypothetical protein EG68_09871 [Paragonimus skrjabini miyazakii]